VRVAFAVTAIVAVIYLAIAGSVIVLTTRNLTDAIDGELLETLHDFQNDAPLPPGNVGYEPPQDGPLPGAQLFQWTEWQDGTTATNASYQGNPVGLPSEYQAVQAPCDATISGTRMRIAGAEVGSAYVVVGEALQNVQIAEASTVNNEAAIAPILLLAVFLGSVAIGRRVAAPVEQARRRQVEFTADASHELRTPLSVIEANASLALAQKREPDRDQLAFQRVVSESKRMHRLVDDMLWLARFDSARAAPAGEPVDVVALAHSTADRFSAVAGERELQLLVQSSVPDAAVAVPAEWLDRLLRVLIDNALKFSPPGGVVMVSVSVSGNRVQLTVGDSGPGIPEDQRARVFDRFHRGTESKSGAGLGLAIADAVVQATDGRWRIGSSPVGGASMSVSWPRAFSGSMS
jgi:signal transduction histidine kinase